MGAADIRFGYRLIAGGDYTDLPDGTGLSIGGVRVIGTDRALITRSAAYAALPAAGVIGRLYCATSIFNTPSALLFDNGETYAPPQSMPGSAMRGDEDIGLGFTSPRWNAWDAPITTNRIASVATVGLADGDEFYFARRATATGSATTSVRYGAGNNSSRVVPINVWVVLRFFKQTARLEISMTGSL